MFSVIIAVLVGLGLGVALNLTALTGIGWAIFWGIFAAILTQLGMGFAMKKAIMGRMNGIQAIIQQGQTRLQRQIQVMQSKPMSSVKHAQKAIEKQQRKFIEEALEATKSLEPFYRWSLLLRRQVTTMRMQFYYQLQDWKHVDELLPKCIFMEPMSSAMKLARLYKQEKFDEIEAFYNKAIKRTRYNQGTILYALYSWILVKRGEIEDATRILVEGKKNTDSNVLVKNWELLANGKSKQFSNAGIGDEWYALALEQPKAQVRRQRQRGGFRQF